MHLAREVFRGRGDEPSQRLRREIVASGDQIIDASAGFDQGAIVHITLDAVGGESMLRTTQENLNKPMSTLFIETNRVERTINGERVTQRVTTREIINTATIRGVFKDRFQISGLTPGEAGSLALLLRAGALAAPGLQDRGADDRSEPGAGQHRPRLRGGHDRFSSRSLPSWRFTIAASG